MQRISDPVLYELARLDMHSEAIEWAFREQRSVDQALSDAEQALNVVWQNPISAQQAWRRSLSRKEAAPSKLMPFKC